jgi:hypothetical protein
MHPSAVHNFGQAIEHIAKNGASLVELSLANLPLFETSASVALARGCRALRKLDLSECENVNAAAVRRHSNRVTMACLCSARTANPAALFSCEGVRECACILVTARWSLL